MEINSIPYSVRSTNGEDRLNWNGANRGDFDLKSTYAIATECSDEGGVFTGTWVWKVDTLPRIKTFMWQCLHNSIRMGECLVRRCLSEPDICPLCQRELETIHRLRNCEAAKNTWSRLGITLNNNFYKESPHHWLEKNCKDNACRLNNQPHRGSYFLLQSGSYGSIGINGL